MQESHTQEQSEAVITLVRCYGAIVGVKGQAGDGGGGGGASDVELRIHDTFHDAISPYYKTKVACYVTIVLMYMYYKKIH